MKGKKWLSLFMTLVIFISLLPVPAIQAEEIHSMEDSLIAHYDMSKSNGKLKDVTNNGFDAEYVGFNDGDFLEDQSYSVLNFTGDKSKYVKLPKGLITDETFTIETTFSTETEAMQWLFTLGTKNGNWPNVNNYVFFDPMQPGGKVRFGIKDAERELLFQDASIASGEYQTFTATFEEGVITLYLNGILVGKLPHTYSIMDIIEAGVEPASDFIGYLGKSLYNPDPAFFGKLTDFKVYNYALTESEIANKVGLDTVQEVTLNKTSATLKPGKADTLVATALPSNATNKEVTFISDNNDVVRISNVEFDEEAGTTSATITALKEGNAVITAETLNGTFAEYNVEVLAPSEDETLAGAKTELVIPNAGDVRGNLTFPTELSVFGETVNVSWKSSNTDIITDEATGTNGEIPAGVVTRQDTDTQVKLTATLIYNTLSDTKEFTLTVKAKPETKDYSAYLMTHFTGEHSIGEQIYFASSEDGLNWEDVNQGSPVLTSDIGEKGVRDPYILRSPEGDKFYLIATDLRIANGKGWGIAQTAGSKSLIVWESTDLVNWSEPRMVEVAPEHAGSAWAPEAIYDETTGEYIVFWASNIKTGDGWPEPYNIYYAKTRDFNTFTEPKIYIDRPGNQTIIDTTIIEDNGTFYRYSADGQITIEKSDAILGDWSEVGGITWDEIRGHAVEGPLIFKFNDRDEWNLMVDQYSTGQGYLPLILSDLSKDEFEIGSGSLGTNRKRHGSVLNITQEEYEAIKSKWTEVVEPPAEEEQEEPMLEYNFDETSVDNTIQDSSGNDYNGTLNGNAAYVTDDEKGSQVLKLDGTNNTFAAFPQGFFDGRDTVTISMDIKAETVSGNFFTFTVGKDNQRYNFLRTRDTEIRNAITKDSWQNEQEVKTSTPSIQGKWMNIQLVITPTSMAMYKDGRFVDENNEVTVSMSDLGTDLLAYLGKSFYSGDKYFEGSFDNVKVYNRALSEEEILESTLSSTDIANFEIPGQRGQTVIDDEAKTVSVGFKGEDVDVTNLTPTISVLPNSTVSPASGEAQDFTNPVTYTVTDKDGNTQEWTASVEIYPSSTLPGLYADPQIAVFGETYYIYPTTDGFDGWSGSQFKAFSSNDLINWKDEGVILDLATDDVTWADNRAWAPTITEKDGTYYYYFSADANIGVATSPSPTGPFKDALDKPLVPSGKYPGQAIDPYAFKDDDGQYYFYWGNGNLFGAKLNDDMVSFAETPINMTPANFREAPVVFKRNGIYYLMWSEDDTGSENYQVAYATGTSPMGPWTKKGVILSKDLSLGIKGPGHHSVLNIPNTDEYYIVYARHAIPDGNGFNREVVIDKMEFNADGTIKKVIPTLKGITEPVYIEKGDTESPVGNFTINSGAEYTSEKAVTLSLEATDDSSGVHQVRYSTDAKEWTDWEAYTTSKEFMVPSGDGEKIVFVEFKDKAGNVSETYQQKIILDTTAPVIEFTGLQDSYSIDESINITCKIVDELSGIASKECSNVEGLAYSFEVGVNKYTASATDKAGNKAEVEIQFTVAVDFDSLSRLTEALVTKQGVAESLTNKLQAAKASAAKENNEAENSQLKAYKNQLNAQIGKSITEEDSNLLGSLADLLKR